MSKALSLDLRVRVLAAVAAGASHRTAALRFGVSAASVSRWRQRAAAQGNPGPRALGGDRRSGRIEQHREQILGVLADQPDLTIEELRRALARRGLHFGFGTLHRFLVRHRMTRKKKTGHASEQDRPDVHQRRQAWAGVQARLDPARLVFLDETGTKTNMARTPGRASRTRMPPMFTSAQHRARADAISRIVATASATRFSRHWTSLISACASPPANACAMAN
jgi:transposase